MSVSDWLARQAFEGRGSHYFREIIVIDLLIYLWLNVFIGTKYMTESMWAENNRRWGISTQFTTFLDQEIILENNLLAAEQFHPVHKIITWLFFYLHQEI